MRLNLHRREWGLRLRRLGGGLLLAAGLVVGTMLAIGLPNGTLAAGATYGPNCPDFDTFAGDVQAVGNGDSATFTFNTNSVCVYPAGAVTSLTIQDGATVIINGNDKLKIEGGTADAPGDFGLIFVGRDATLTLNGASLLYGEIGIAASSFAGAATINVTGTTIEGNYANGIWSASGDVTVEQSTISNNGDTGIVADTGKVTITGSTVSGNGYDGAFTYNGDVTITNSSLDQNANDGVHVHDTGSVTATKSTFRNNDTDGIETDAGYPDQSVVTVEDCTITGNRKYGIHNHANEDNGSISVTNSVVSDNGKSDPDNDIDSGILADSGDITVAHSMVSGNGDNGVHTYDGDIVVNDSTINGNGVIDSNNETSTVTYAGVFTDTGNVTVTNSTISDNLAFGIDAPDGTATVVLSTIQGNGVGETAKYGIDASGAINLTGTILADNASTNCHGAVTDHGYNLSTDASCQLAPPNSRNSVSDSDLNLQDLADNDGPSVGAPDAQQVLQTIALGSSSVAIDPIPATDCSSYTYPDGSPVNTDERGVSRPQGPGCDIGAYEAINRTAFLPGSTTTVHRGYFALLRIEALGSAEQNISSRRLHVSSVELDGPDGQTISFVHQFQFGRFSGTPGYQLSINTRNLDPGIWTLKVKIGTDPQLYSVTFTVI